MGDPYRWYVGVDWASEEHWLYMTSVEARKIGKRTFKHSGDGLAEMAVWLMKTSGAVEPRQIAVGIEVPDGPVDETLLERGFAPSTPSIPSRWIVSETGSRWPASRTTAATPRS